MKIQSGPMQQISMDFLSINTRQNSVFKVLTVVDDFSRYGWAIDVKSENAQNAAKMLYKHIYSRFGFPQVIHSDQGKTFLSKVLKQLGETMQTQMTTSTTYRPQSNGGCERLNLTIIDKLSTLNPKQKDRWHEELPSIMYGYNSVVHSSTGMSPFYAMFLRTPRMPLDCLYDVPQVNEAGYADPISFAEKKKVELQQVINLIKQRSQREQERNKQAHDNRHWRPVEELHIGDRVLVKKHIRSDKIDDKWDDDIYIIVQIDEKCDVIFELQGLQTGKIRRAHRNHIKRFQESITNHVDRGFCLSSIPTWNMHRMAERCDSDFPVRPEVNAKVSIWRGTAAAVKCDVVASVLENSPTQFDTVIYQQGGSKLLSEYRKDRMPDDGIVRQTGGFDLHANYVLHIVGPGKSQPIGKWKIIYDAVLDKAIDVKAKTMALDYVPLTGTRKQDGINMLMQAVRDTLEKSDRWKRIVICIADDNLYKLYLKSMPVFFPLSQVDLYTEEPIPSEDDEEEILWMEQEAEHEEINHMEVIDIADAESSTDEDVGVDAQQGPAYRTRGLRKCFKPDRLGYESNIVESNIFV